MPSVYIIVVWAAIAAAGCGLLFWGAETATQPNPAVHAAVIQACNGPTEIAALTAANAAAVAQMKAATTATSTMTTAAGSLTTTARVVSGEYVVTVGSGSTAKTCHTPIVKRSL